MNRRWLHAAILAVFILTTAGGPALALCGATADSGCCCGTGSAPSPCRGSAPAGAAACCAPTSPGPSPAVATASGATASAEFVGLAPRPAIERHDVHAACTPRADALARSGPPPLELFTLHAAFLI